MCSVLILHSDKVTRASDPQLKEPRFESCAAM